MYTDRIHYGDESSYLTNANEIFLAPKLRARLERDSQDSYVIFIRDFNLQ